MYRIQDMIFVDKNEIRRHVLETLLSLRDQEQTFVVLWITKSFRRYFILI